MISATANSVEVYKVAGDGSTTQAKGATITDGGVTVTAGGLTVTDSGATTTTTGAAVTPLKAVNSHATFTGDAFVVATTTAAGTGFDMISATANSVEVYKVAGDGSTTQAKGAT